MGYLLRYSVSDKPVYNQSLPYTTSKSNAMDKLLFMKTANLSCKVKKSVVWLFSVQEHLSPIHKDVYSSQTEDNDYYISIMLRYFSQGIN